MISICVTIKNRSRVLVEDRELQLFPRCVRSIVSARPRALEVELVVSDFDSDDWPLAEWLPEAAADLPLTVVRVEGGFSRGRGRNEAAKAARGDVLFFLDADSLIAESVLTRGDELVRAGRAYFPVVYSYDGPDHTTGNWHHYGLGNCIVSRAHFDASGGWPEYAKWGREDDDFHTRIGALTEIVREESPGFYHQWHPDEILWKDRYIARDPDEVAELERVAATCIELETTLPPDATFVLLDEDRFGHHQKVLSRARPFLEVDGLYGGPPPDGVIATAELRRMVREGSRFVALTWIANWWLEHYAELRDYLEREGTLLVENERLRLYEMTS